MPPRLFQIKTAQTHTQPIRSMSIGPRSSRVYATGGDDGFLHLYSVNDDTPIYRFGSYDSPITCSSFHYSEDFISFGTNNGIVQILDLDSRKTTASWTLENRQITCIHYHPINSEYIAAGDSEGHVYVFSSQERNPIQQYKAHNGQITCVKFSPDGTLLASSGSDCLIRLFQVLTGECFTTIRQNCPKFLSLAFHPTDMILAGCSDDRSVHIFSFEYPSNNDEIKPVTRTNSSDIYSKLIEVEMKGNFVIGNASPLCITFSKDGQVLASCSSSVLSVFKTFSPDFADHLQIGQKKVHDIQLYSTCVAIASSTDKIGTVIFIKTDDFRLLKKEKIKPMNNEMKDRVKSNLQNKVIDGSNLNDMRKTVRKNHQKGLADLQPNKQPISGAAANDMIYKQFKAKRPSYIEILEMRKSKFSFLYDRIKTKGALFTITEIATTGDGAWEFATILQKRPQTINFENVTKCIEVIKFAFDDDPVLAINLIGLILDIIGPSIMNSNNDKPIPEDVTEDDMIEISESVKTITPYLQEAANNDIEEAKSILQVWSSILF